MRQKISKNNFFGRQNELDRIERFLNEPSGGAILIAGDRGSGKTTLIMHALKQLRNKRSRVRMHTFEKDIIVHIPLILGAGGAKTNPAYYRSLLMRTILRALDSDLRMRKYKYVDLPKRWFRSIGYLQSVNALLPYSRYLTASESRSSNLSISAALHATGSAGMERAVSGDIDISDASLEIKLRNLFAVYSDIHNFIIVLDELDKLELDANGVQLEKIALFLKNLFSETNIHVIFISDEPPLGRILAKINADPFCAEKTLFKDLILLNQLNPKDFETLVSSEFPLQKEEWAQKQLVYGLMHSTNMMPSELKRFILQNGRSQALSRLESQVDQYSYLYRVAMQYFVNHIFEAQIEKYDAYHDRILYKALVLAGENLLSMNVKYFSAQDYLTVLAPTAVFPSDAYERQAKEVLTNWHHNYDQAKAPQTLSQVIALPSDTKDHIARCIAQLVCLLDRNGWLTIKKYSLNTPYFFEIITFNGDSFTLHNIKESPSEAMRMNEQELESLITVKRFDALYKQLKGSHFWADLIPNPINERSMNSPSNQPLPSNSPTDMLRLSWAPLIERTGNIESTIMELIGSSLAGKLDTPPMIDIKDSEIEIQHNNKLYLITFKSDKRSLSRSNRYKKYFIILDQDTSSKATSRGNVKAFKLTKDAGNIDAILLNIATVMTPKTKK